LLNYLEYNFRLYSLFLAQIAFIVAFGVLLDTVIVRSLVVPGLTLTIGKPMWWPSKLAKKKGK
jgi:RND superfamily putative drug exporter